MKNFLLLFFIQFAFAQETVKLAADRFAGIDPAGNYYGIADNTFFRVGDGKMPEYKNVSLGKITHVDLINPLKIVLFYGDFNTAVLLDNQLNETQRVNFSSSKEMLTVTACGLASQNRLWFYDSLSMQLGLYDYLRNGYVFITQPLAGNIKFYDSDFNYFHWVDDNRKHFVCDVFGKIREYGTLPEYDALRFDDIKGIWLLKDNVVYYQESGGSSRKVLEIPDKSVKSFWVKDQILSIFTDHGITNYKISKP